MTNFYEPTIAARTIIFLFLLVYTGYYLNYIGAERQSRVAAKGGSSRPILIKADASLTMQSFLDVCELARKAGFPGVLVAADER